MQFGHAASLLVAGERELGTNIVHLQLANRVDVSLEVVVAQVFHQLLYSSPPRRMPTSLSHQNVHPSLRTEVLVMVPQVLRQSANTLRQQSNYVESHSTLPLCTSVEPVSEAFRWNLLTISCFFSYPSHPPSSNLLYSDHFDRAC